MNKAFASDIDGTLFFHYLNPPIKKVILMQSKNFKIKIIYLVYVVVDLIVGL
ncbi:hypothetical protein SD457_13495 [Coprobacillaceae bacterium CR2/5/TPMF4]|nr:hypothetical protein SD457_13495 [Coprobacillaceae bacterium CR2/5/TPMF4]